MRRLARHLFTLCSAVSLLLCVAVCALWVQSYRGGFWFGDPNDLRVHAFGNKWWAYTNRGGLSVYWIEWPRPGRLFGSQYMSADPSMLGFGLNAVPPGTVPPGWTQPYARQGTLRMPLWFVTSAFAILPATQVALHKRR